MAKFIFNMQGLLNIKEKLEEQTKTEYGKALAKLEQEKSILLNLKNKKQENILSFRESINKGVKPNYIDNINKYISFIDKKVEEQMQNINKAKEIVEEKRLALLEAMKERKVLETLKEKEKENYFKEELKNEQKIIDEIVSYKYNKA
ncbi:MAG: flagellar export protein FliJ [Clostridiales bacterium]|nr:flagellar export protein FliJ [Clostridiales bacterium]